MSEYPSHPPEKPEQEGSGLEEIVTPEAADEAKNVMANPAFSQEFIENFRMSPPPEDSNPEEILRLRDTLQKRGLTSGKWGLRLVAALALAVAGGEGALQVNNYLKENAANEQFEKFLNAHLANKTGMELTQEEKKEFVAFFQKHPDVRRLSLNLFKYYEPTEKDPRGNAYLDGTLYRTKLSFNQKEDSVSGYLFELVEPPAEVKQFEDQTGMRVNLPPILTSTLSKEQAFAKTQKELLENAEFFISTDQSEFEKDYASYKKHPEAYEARIENDKKDQAEYIKKYGEPSRDLEAMINYAEYRLPQFKQRLKEEHSPR